MQYLFCDHADKPSREPAEEPFLLQETPQSLDEAVEREQKELERVQRSGRLPAGLSILKTVALALGLIFVAGILKADVSLEQGYHNAPALYWIGACSLLVGGALFLIEKAMQRRAGGKEAVQTALNRLNRAEAEIREYHAIPVEAEWVEILAFSYRGGEEAPTICDAARNSVQRLFVRNGALCLFDGARLYAFPQNELAGIRLVEGEIPLEKWNKSMAASREQFQRCGVTQDGKGRTGLRFCCALDLVRDGETCSLLFPAYELSAMERLTGLKAPELPLTVVKKEKIRPLFYWKTSMKDAADWFSPSADDEFKACHPVLYVVLVIVGLLGLFLPMILFIVFVTRVPGAIDNRWAILGLAGSFVIGIGLANLVAAWQHQYLGHLVTIVCFLAGGAMMTASCLLIF